MSTLLHRAHASRGIRNGVLCSTGALAVALGTLLVGTPADATNGYFSHGYGIKYKGLAGAGAALHLGPMAAATNPGAMVFLGTVLYIIGLILVDITYTIVDPRVRLT